MKNLLTFAAAAALFAVQAAPQIAVTAKAQDATRRVTVNYVLSGEPAVVTLAAERRVDGEWTALPAKSLAFVSGDLNRLVQPGAHVAMWTPDDGEEGIDVDDDSFRVRVVAWPTNSPPDYLVLDMTIRSNATWYVSADQIPGGVTNALYKTEKMVLRRIPAANATFRMGTVSAEYGNGHPESTTLRRVTFTRDFYAGIYLVTVAQSARMRNAESRLVTPDNNVSYNVLRGTSLGAAWPVYNGDVFDEAASHRVDAGSYVDSFRAWTGFRLDLPTHAQWEYAARAETSSALHNGRDLEFKGVEPDAGLDEVGWSAGGVGGQGKLSSCEVGLKKPNAWGLYDVHGNVGEWALDWYQDGVGNVPDADAVDYVGPKTGATRWYCGTGVAYNGNGSHLVSIGCGMATSWSRADSGYRLVCPAEAVR